MLSASAEIQRSSQILQFASLRFHTRQVVVIVVVFACCDAQLVPDLRRPPAGRGCSVESDQFASRDIRMFSSDVSYRRSCFICTVL